jgi:glycosyltransferase involved in cell wall biosynthesis
MQKKITVLFDFYAFHNQRFGGVSRYFYEIISRMTMIDSDIALQFSMNKYISDHDVIDYTAVPKPIFKFLEGIFRKINKYIAVKKIRHSHFDIFHPTYYNPYFLRFIGDKPFVLTIHDMTHEMYPQFFSPLDPTALYKRKLAEKASRIIAISEFTKSKIVEILGIEEDKIDVIYHGLSRRPLGTGRPKGLPANYILYVGERRRYKNFNRVAEAFARLVNVFPDFRLVLTGRKLSVCEREMFRKLKIKDYVTVYSDIDDDVLDQLYHHARLFVYPSLCEGFGIPILEAFAQNCPVVLSRESCFPEIGGDACEYFDAFSADDLLRAMHRVIESPDYREMLIERGRRRLERFTWDSTAEKTEETYRKVMQQ